MALGFGNSFYLLELSVEPGGARRAHAFAYNQLEHIRSCLEWEFSSTDKRARLDAANLAIGYGEVIALWTFDGGELVDGIDLHRFLRARVDGGAPLTLSDREQLRDVTDRLAATEECDVAFDIDWDGIVANSRALTRKAMQVEQWIFLKPATVGAKAEEIARGREFHRARHVSRDRRGDPIRLQRSRRKLVRTRRVRGPRSTEWRNYLTPGAWHEPNMLTLNRDSPAPGFAQAHDIAYRTVLGTLSECA